MAGLALLDQLAEMEKMGSKESLDYKAPLAHKVIAVLVDYRV